MEKGERRSLQHDLMQATAGVLGRGGFSGGYWGQRASPSLFQVRQSGAHDWA
jgi:hypothetical protein